MVKVLGRDDDHPDAVRPRLPVVLQQGQQGGLAGLVHLVDPVDQQARTLSRQSRLQQRPKINLRFKRSAVDKDDLACVTEGTAGDRFGKRSFARPGFAGDNQGKSGRQQPPCSIHGLRQDRIYPQGFFSQVNRPQGGCGCPRRDKGARCARTGFGQGQDGLKRPTAIVQRDRCIGPDI